MQYRAWPQRDEAAKGWSMRPGNTFVKEAHIHSNYLFFLGVRDLTETFSTGM